MHMLHIIYIYIRRKVFKLVPRRERVNVYIYIHYIQYVGCLSGTWTNCLNLNPLTPCHQLRKLCGIVDGSCLKWPAHGFGWSFWTSPLLFGKCWFSSSMGAEISLPPNCDDVAPSMLSSWDIINPYRNQSPTQIGDNRSVFSDLIINMFHHCGCGNSSNPSLQW